MTSTEFFSSAAVAAPHRLASEAGRDVLIQGGNAIEAMLAMAATIAIVYPHMNGIGGDGFWLIHEPRGKVRAIEACGFAGANATAKRYREMELEAVPARGPLAAMTVPGAIGGWSLAHELAQAMGARMPLKELLANATRHARDGVAVSGSESRTKPRDSADLAAMPGFARTYFVEGEHPKAGAVRKFSALAATLDQLANDGLEDFYRGDIAREIATDLEKIGSPVTREDLRTYRAQWRQPLKLAMKGHALYNFPPPTQGLASLIILGAFARLGVTRADTFEHIHGLIEATKRAFAVRDSFITDFDRLKGDPDDFLTPEYLDGAAGSISMSKAAPFPMPPANGDTVWMGAVDKDGLAVSYIQSIYWEYGSGCVLPRTGVLMQNRGVAFSLDETALNPLTPGRRPFHTLNPALATFADGRVMPYGTMGGDGQPQTQAQVFTRYMFGAGLAEAIDAPRFALGRTWGAASSLLALENRFDPSLIRALEKAGHELAVHADPYADMFGHAGGLIRHARDGRIEAAHDPRADGGADGI
jgi:gamma-glutamyltranspeptidase